MPVIYGQVSAPSNNSAADGTNQPWLQGKLSEGIVAELHGLWYTAAYRGKAFHGSSAIAGTILPRETTTTATFMLYNPVTSGVNLELISTDIGLWTTTMVIGGIMMATGTPAPTTTTAITATVTPSLVGGGFTPKAALYSAATITAMSFFYPMFQITATTTGTDQNYGAYNWNGRICLAPGTGAMPCSNPVQTNSTINALDWAEWPI